jgi:hypothetical protein
MLYELMWWHTLNEDASPLAYVTALRFAQQRECRGTALGSFEARRIPFRPDCRRAR